MYYKDYIDKRALILAEYFIEHKSTVRKTAEQFNVPKSVVYQDITSRLDKLNPVLAQEIRSILLQNKAERHLRGGEATRWKYSKKR